MNDLARADVKAKSVEAVWQEAQKLSADDKAELVNRLLGKESGLIVVSTNSHLVDYIIAQMNLLSLEGLAYIMRAIAARMASEGRNSKA